MNPLTAIAGLLALGLVGAAPVAAEEAAEALPAQLAASQDQSGEQSPEAVIDEVTEDEKVKNEETGETEAATGGAEPEENWFGCPPKEGEAADQDVNPQDVQTAENSAACEELDSGGEGTKTQD